MISGVWLKMAVGAPKSLASQEAASTGITRISVHNRDQILLYNITHVDYTLTTHIIFDQISVVYFDHVDYLTMTFSYKVHIVYSLTTNIIV